MVVQLRFSGAAAFATWIVHRTKLLLRIRSLGKLSYFIILREDVLLKCTNVCLQILDLTLKFFAM